MADKTVVVRIVVRANQFSSGLKGASADVQQFAGDVEGATKRAGSSTLALGAASATAGKLILLGVGGAMAVSAKAAIDFESSLAGVAKTTDLTGSAFARAGSPLAAFGEALRSLSMRIPLNANELARIAELGGQLGVEVPNLISFTETMAALGVSTNLAAEEAATGLARFVNIMGTSQTEFGRLGSIIVELGNNLATTESEILTFALRLAPIGRTVGMAEDEVLGLAGALTSLGIPAERGGTALQRFFIDLQSAVQSGGDDLEKFARMAGTTVEEFQALFNESPSQAFLQILKGLDELQERGGSAAGALRELGVIQQRSIQVLLAASNGWETVGTAIGLANEESDKGTALQEEAARRYGTTASQIKILGNAFNDLRIEVGNALLGSGGLAAGIDFLREFARIVKDNLPLLGRLVGVLTAVSLIRLGANILDPIIQGIGAFRNMKGAIDGMTRATAAARLGMLGLNTAVWGAVAVAGFLITKWATAAIKAAELRRAARDLQDQIEQGADPVEAFIDALRTREILLGDQVDLLNKAGISEEQFARAIMAGGDAISTLEDDFRAGLEATEEFQEALDFDPDTSPVFVFPGLLGDFDQLVHGAQEVGDAFRDLRTDDLRNAFLEAGAGIDEATILAERAMNRFSFDVPIDEAVRRQLAGFEEFPQAAMAMAHGVDDATSNVGLSWREMVLQLEDGGDRIVDFLETSAGAVEGYRDTLTESFEEVKEEILGQFPAWDEYEQTSIDSLDGVLEAQRGYLEDLRAGFELQDELVGRVGGRTMEWFENLPTQTKGALARFKAENEDGFWEFLQTVEKNLGEAGGILKSEWEDELPDVQRRAFAAMFAVAAEEAKGFGGTGEQTASAIMEGLEAQMAFLSESDQQTYLDFIAGMFQDEAFLKSIGLDIGNPVVQGFIEALGTISSKATPVIKEQARIVTNRWGDEYEIGSPSKVTMRIGEEVAKGFFVGLEDQFNKEIRSVPPPAAQILNPNPVINVNVPDTGGGMGDINIINPQHKDDDILDNLQRATTVVGLTRIAESIPN